MPADLLDAAAVVGDIQISSAVHRHTNRATESGAPCWPAVRREANRPVASNRRDDAKETRIHLPDAVAAAVEDIDVSSAVHRHGTRVDWLALLARRRRKNQKCRYQQPLK